ncbi:unnamed protein product [Blumeria hordei]|uniref:Uncharacterized protein n=2 Tax=Blumeria hordei TaxID=2867405 RepID=A0A383V1D5_BLUHO|nr:putative candidate secreted effector protein [Blumeria hordei DH14]SZF06414.1 unnamed protein product [Blumeria hordei]
MKLFSAALMAALSGLLSSATADNGRPQFFACRMGIHVHLSDIYRFEDVDYYKDAEPGDPEGPNGERYRARRLFKRTYGGSYGYILIQATDEYPFNRVFEDITGEWLPCSFHLLDSWSQYDRFKM